MSLPLSLGIVATDISQDDTEGPIKVSGVVGGTTKNASCSELGDENASCSDLGGLQLPGVRWPYMCGAMATREGRVDLGPFTYRRPSKSLKRCRTLRGA